MQTGIELEEFVFIQEDYEEQLDRSKTLKLFPPKKEDYVRHILHSFDLSEVSTCSQVIGLDHETVDDEYSSVYFKNGISITVKMKYEDFKKLFNSYKEYVKRQQFNNK